METQHGEFEFDGSGWGFVWTTLGVAILAALTFGIAAPWLWCWQMRWFVGHIIVGGKRLQFTGTGWNYLGMILLIMLLTLVTLGLYAPWGVVRMWRWILANSSFADTEGSVQQPAVQAQTVNGQY